MNKLLTLAATLMVSASTLCASLFHRTLVLSREGLKEVGKLSSTHQAVTAGPLQYSPQLRREAIDQGYLLVFANCVVPCSPKQEFFAAHKGIWLTADKLQFHCTLLAYGGNKVRLKKVLPLYGSSKAEFVSLETPQETIYYVSELLLLTREQL